MAELNIERKIGGLIDRPRLSISISLETAPLIDEYTELISAIETIVGVVERSAENA